jgi:ParB family chromosome partitioning protein
MKVSIAEINVGKRFRKELGDIQALADSLKEVGLLQALGVAPDEKQGYQLVFGQRRLEAAKTLGWTQIECKVVNLGSILDGEYHENEMRKDFTPSERVAIGKALEERVGERRGRHHEDEKENVENFPHLEQGVKTRELAASQAGFGNDKTYREAKAVVDKAEPEVVAAMDSGAMSIHAAAETAKLSGPRQRAIAEFFANGEADKGHKEIKKAARKPRMNGQAKPLQAKKPPKPPTVKAQIKADLEANPELKDELDEPVPEVLREVFTKGREFRIVINQLNEINRVLQELATHPAGAHMRLQQAQIDLKNLKRTVEFDAPYAVCPMCKADDKHRKANCPCEGRGWLIRGKYQALPVEYRK